MADLTRQGLNAQKREPSVSVALQLTEAEILADAIPFVLPANVVVSSVDVNVTTASTTVSATVDVLVGTTVIANEVAANAAGVVTGTPITTARYFATGGAVHVVGGATLPAAGDLILDLIIQYIELDKTSGEYTNYL